MDKLKDKIWTWIIVLSMIGYLLLMSLYTQGQVRVDTIASKKFKNHYEFISQQHKQRIDELENPDKYQMIYFDKAIIDRKNHKIYLYSSYDLYWAEEIGMTWNVRLPHKTKEIHFKKKKQ
jgi:hypothetical protein